MEVILRFGMTDLEAKAYKISLLWEKIVKKEFPDYQNVKLRKKGDPRKSVLFKYCYKLARETQGILEDKEYKFYILAQLRILRSIKNGDVHALIGPQCLVGDKAWVRWKIWKKEYLKKANCALTDTEVGVLTPESVIKSDLLATKKFFIEIYNGVPNFDNIQRNIYDRMMIKWVTLGKVSPYYILLSPFVHKICDNIEEIFKFDPKIYKTSITPNVKTYFEQEFGYEF